MSENKTVNYTVYTQHEKFYVAEERIINLKNDKIIIGYKMKDIHDRFFWINAQTFDRLFEKQLF